MYVYDIYLNTHPLFPRILLLVSLLYLLAGTAAAVRGRCTESVFLLLPGGAVGIIFGSLCGREGDPLRCCRAAI